MDLRVAFWNLGNLFDTQDDFISNDLDFTPAKGWTPATQANKVANLALVIDAMFDGDGPDLLGICEVENESTLQQLVDAVSVRSDLKVATYEDSSDIRGIDCALIYSTEVFEAITLGGDEPDAPSSHLVHNRYPTRDIFEVPLKVRENGAELIVFVNHWPSRSRGQYESEPLRIAAANHLGRLVDQRLKFSRQQIGEMADSEASMQKIQARWDRNVLLMGDFNDEPFSRSIIKELKASSGLDKVEEPVKKSGGNEHIPAPEVYAKLQAHLFNCMWPLAAEPDRGSYHYSSGVPTFNVLDHFIVSRGLYYGNAGLRMMRNRQLVAAGSEVEIELKNVAADVFDADFMLTSQATRRPKKFEFKLKDGVAQDNDGFSDHFPIVTRIEVR